MESQRTLSQAGPGPRLSYQADVGLRESEERFRQVLESIGAVFYLTECPDERGPGQVVYASPSYEQLWGHPLAGFYQDTRSWLEAVHPEDIPRVMASLPGLVRGSFDQQFRIVRPDGEIRWVHDRVFPVRNERGEVFRVAGIVMDITDLKRTEAEVQRLNRSLQERLVELQTVMNVLPVGIAVAHDPECRVITADPGFTDLLGLPPGSNISKSTEEGRGLPYKILRGGREVPAGELPMQTAIAQGAPIPVEEVDILLADGRILHYLVTAAPLFDEQVRVRGCIEAHFDITERKQAEERLRQAKEAAEAANQAKDRFLAALSHELRTPLTPILAVVSRLERDERLDPLVREELSMIRRNAELEARLIDDLLDLTRIARGKLELHPGVVDLRQILDHALQTCCSPDQAARRPRIVTDCAPVDLHVWGDAPRLTQVLWNLLNNAVKFTPAEGTITVRTSLEERHGTRQVALEIADTGIGIEPAALPKIFEGFEQGDRTITRQFGGLGLGLAISKAIAELHGGDLTAESEGRGKGSKFILQLPIGEDVAAAGAPADSLPGGDTRAPESDRALHILLVEDHADTAEAMADLLRLLGHRVEVAGSVAAALATAEAHAQAAFDLVVSDLGLPDGSGLALMRELTRRYGLKGIAVSGYGMEEDIRKSREAGFERHLTKPINLQTLETAIRQATAAS